MSKALLPPGGNEIEPRPVKLPGFEFHWNGQVIPVETANGKRPTIDQFMAALSYCAVTYKASPLWVGYLIAYAEDREDWADRFDQAIAFTGLSRQRIHHLASVVRNVPIDNLQIAQSTAHATEVKSLPRKDQKKVARQECHRGLEQVAAACRVAEGEAAEGERGHDRA